MAHGIYHSYDIKHDDILDAKRVRSTYNDRYNKEAYHANYKFVWEIYNEVARKHGIVIPKTWVTADPATRRDRYRSLKKNWFILEPRGPIVHVDTAYSINTHLHMHFTRASVLHSHNWYDYAERFFMVRWSAKRSLSKTTYFRHGYLCESWRAKSMELLYRREKD